jgi:hypothetical protein
MASSHGPTVAELVSNHHHVARRALNTVGFEAGAFSDELGAGIKVGTLLFTGYFRGTDAVLSEWLDRLLWR